MTSTTALWPKVGDPRLPSQRRDIQGLRAFAVVVVMLNHFLGVPGGGFVGVDIFFVLSGFLITGLLVRDLERDSRISFRRFYARRSRRILPAGVTVLVATVFASWLLLPSARFEAARLDGAWALLFVSNWRFAIEGTDYFNEGRIPSPLQHYWSLSVEEQFYLVWPVVMLLAWWIAARYPHARRRILTAIMAVVVVASLVWSIAQTASDPSFSYFSTLTRSWELGVGALLALLAPTLARVPRRMRPALAWGGIALMIGSLFGIDNTTPFPGPGAILPVLGVSLVLASGVGGNYQGPGPLTARPVGYLGDISYSLYLWHWPVAILLQAVLPRASVGYAVVAVLLTLGLSVVSYHWIEQPLRHVSWSAIFTAPGRGLRRSLAGVIAVALIAAVGGVVIRPALRPTFPLPKAYPSADVRACLGAAELTRAEECRTKLTGLIAPSPDTYTEDTAGAYQCWRGKDQVLKPCVRGSKRSDALPVALVGDSHAAALLPALILIAKQLNWRLDVYTGFGCQWMKSETSNCRTDMARLQPKLASGDYTVIFTTGARQRLGPDTADAPRRYAAAWAPAVEAGSKVVAIGDVPLVEPEALSCLNTVTFRPDTSRCGTPREVALAVPDPMPAAADIVPGTGRVDLTGYFCDTTFCPSVIGHAIVYRDTVGHVTGTYARSMVPALREDLKRAALG